MDFEQEFKAILCNRAPIINALSSMLIGMNMYNRGLKYNYVFHSLSTNASKRYSEAGLYMLNNLASSGQSNGNDIYNEAIDKEYICLIMHGKVYTSVYTAVLMARQASYLGKTYIFNFQITGRGGRAFNQTAILAMAKEAESTSNCAAILAGENVTDCVDYFSGA